MGSTGPLEQMSTHRTIVISAVNLRKGGTLTILRQCLSFLSIWGENNKYRIVALVHNRELADYPHIEYIELPWAIESWSKRLWCEYITMHKISKQLGEINLWLSLHDTTPRVKAKNQAVYCQTSFPFLRWMWRDLRFDLKIPLFAIFTRFAYRINIHRNKYLVVQQEWLREGFANMFAISPERFIVAPPERNNMLPEIPTIESDDRYTFFFASTADSHKNFETLCEASRLLEAEVGTNRFRTIITVAGNENRYAQFLYQGWGDVKSIYFAGLMDKPTLYAHYIQAHCFVFPSRIETWGLPISEFISTNQALGLRKYLLLANLPYAHETSAGYPSRHFFEATNAVQLAQLMKEQMDAPQTRQMTKANSAPHQPSYPPPYAKNWEELFKILLD